jgi:hypothetical protein
MGTCSHGEALAMARRRRGGRCEAELHTDAQRLPAGADDPARVKQAILLALRGGHPGTQQGLIWRKAAQHCQSWVPTALTQAVPDLTAKPSVYWLCDRYHGQVSNDDMVARLAQQRRGGTGARYNLLRARRSDTKALISASTRRHDQSGLSDTPLSP